MWGGVTAIRSSLGLGVATSSGIGFRGSDSEITQRAFQELLASVRAFLENFLDLGVSLGAGPG